MRSFHNQGWAGAPTLHIVLADHFALRPAEPPAFAQKHIALHCKLGFGPPACGGFCRHRRCLSASVSTPQAVSPIAHLTWEQLVGRELSMGDPLLDPCWRFASSEAFVLEGHTLGLQND